MRFDQESEKTNRAPSLPIPSPLRGMEPGSWAHHTVARRLQEILQRTIDENDFEDSVKGNLYQLKDEVPMGCILPLQERSQAEDVEPWNDHLMAVRDLNWLQIPWFMAETYFYRRILQETGYFDPASEHFKQDPYALQKVTGLQNSKNRLEGLAVRYLAADFSKPWDQIQELIQASLWGNQADLSIWPAHSNKTDPVERPSAPADPLLIDHTAQILQHLQSEEGQGSTVLLIADNAAVELVADLALAACLLRSGLAGRVVISLKTHPTFVSDATVEDVEDTLTILEKEPGGPLRAFAEDLLEHLRGGRLELVDHPFWTSPHSMWELPGALYRDLQNHRLVILKGDANYRRLLGDRHWPYTAPWEQVVNYFPAPLVALRTLKSEVMVGLEPKLVEQTVKQDRNWMTDGRWGSIQFHHGPVVARRVRES